MIKPMLLVIVMAVSSAAIVAQNTAVTESAYRVTSGYGAKYKVIVAVVANNPYEDKFASYPQARVTVRARDGSIINTRDIHSAGIPPKQKIAFCEGFSADEFPAQVEIRPLDAHYEPTIYKASEFLPFTLINVRARPDGSRLRVTGEIVNPYPGETGAWVTFLFRDANGKLLSGYSKWQPTIPAGAPSAFEMYVDSSAVPEESGKVEQFVFSHNNSQSSWAKLLRR